MLPQSLKSIWAAPSRERGIFAFAVIGLGLLTHVPCSAQTTYDWVGGTSTAWRTGSNWASGTAPAISFSTLQFARFNSNPTNQPGADSAVNIYGIEVAAGATNTLTINGGLGIGAGGITKANGSGQFTVQSARISGTQTWTNDSSTRLQNSNLMSNADATPSRLTLSGTGTGGFFLTTLGDGSGKGPLSVVVNTTSGTTTLSGNAAFTGGVTLAAGILSLDSTGNSPLGTGTFTINGGTLNVTAARATPNNNAQNWNGDFTFLGTNTLDLGTGAVALGGTRTVTVNASSLTVGGVIGGSGHGLTKAGAGTLRLSAANTFSGATTITGGTLALLNGLAIQNSLLDTSGAGVISGTGVTAATFGGLSGSKNLSAVVTTGYGGWNAVTLNPGSGTANYSGVIANGTSSGMSLTKAGNGIQVLSGSNTYTGATTISGGRLVIGPTGSINGSNGVTINGGGLTYNNTTTALAPSISFSGAGGTLSGIGTIGSAITIGSNAILAPGNSPGTLTAANGMTWSTGGTYQWEVNSLGGVAGTNWDLLNVTAGSLDLTGLSTSGKFLLDLTTLTGGNLPGPLDVAYAPGTTYQFAIASFNSLLTPTGFQNSAGSDLTGLFTIGLSQWQGTKPAVGDISVKVNSTGTGIDLVIVPEPETVWLAGIGCAIGAVLRWRRLRGTSGTH